jgi:hypothetical protein
MTTLLCALLVALAQGHGEFGKDKNGSQPTTSDRGAATQPDPGVDAKDSTASNTSDKAETLPKEHPTELQGGAVEKARPAKKAARAKKDARPLPDAYTPPSAEHHGAATEPKTGEGKPPPGREPDMPDDTKR